MTSTADLRMRRNARKVFQFNTVVVGRSGLGKSTFVNSLGNKVIDRQTFQTATMEITPYHSEIEEDGLKISLSVVDTPGFGDAIDNTSQFEQIMQYVEKQYDDFLAEESRIKRNPKFIDNRVHVCLYFISGGHGLHEMDIQYMKLLSHRINVIPVIGKSDMMTTEELLVLKKRCMSDIEFYDIPIFSFPYDHHQDDEDTVGENKELRDLLPFAVTSSLNNKREYPWGTVQVDNLEHCDSVRLKYCLLSSHLTDLKEITQEILYEQYRTEKLSKLEGLAQMQEQPEPAQ